MKAYECNLNNIFLVELFMFECIEVSVWLNLTIVLNV